jgi:alpha-2-macroglobulin
MKRFPFLLFCIAVMATACNRQAVKLSFTNAENEVPVLGNLVFRFSSNLATDSMLNRWDSTAYITFSPEIKGRFRWETKDQLVFSPSGPLLPATSYTANFSTKNLLAATEFKTIEGADNIAFRSPDLALERQMFSWVKDEGTQSPVPVIELYFNYPVKPEALENGLSVVLDETPVNVVYETLNAAPVIRGKIQGVKAEDRDYKVTVTAKKGLLPIGGKNGLQEDQQYEGGLSSPFVLQINEITTEHDGTAGTIFIRTNQLITGDDLTQYISINPSVKYTIEKSGNGLLITGPAFSVENSYSLTLKPGLRGQLGGVLKEPYESALTFGELEPALSFANNKAVYLSAAGQRNLELRITNVPKIKLIVSKVYESNLLTALSYGYYPKEKPGSEDEDYYYYEEGGDISFGDVLYEQEIDTRSLPKFGAGRLLNFNPDDKLPGYKGVYHIMVRSMEDYWVRSSRFISLSDIGLIAKSGGGKMLVFANSIQSANPVSGVGVQVYGTNNQLIGNGSTNSSGVAEITLEGNHAFSGFKPAMVVARLGDDFNYLPFHNTKVNTSKYAVGGKKINTTGLDAFIAPERDLYRPGEVMHFAIIVRDLNRKSPGALPVKIKMLMPNGKELTQIRKTLNDEGVTDADVVLPATAITGTYIMELYNGNDVLVTSYNFKVEEFVPDRIKVTAVVDKETLRANTNAQLNIEALNYFGPPAAGRNYEAELQIKEKPFRPQQYYNYDFTLTNRLGFFDNIVRQGKTDDQGRAAESFAIPESYKGMGILQARFFATVFDENGRPVSRNSTVDVLTQDVLLGMGNTGYNYFALNQPVRFPLIALNPKEQVVNTKAQVTVVKHEYRTVLQKSGGYFRYESQKEEKQLQKQEVNIQGTSAAFNFIPREAGEYEIRLALPGSNTYISNRFYSYGSWGSNIGDFEVNSDGQVDISLDKKGYANGDKVKALFKAPFDGRMLVTMESAEVLSHQWVDVKNRTASVDFALTDMHIPNAYITATLFKPHTTGSALPLTAAHGIANLDVKDDSKRLAVSIRAAANSRSEKRQRVTVKTSSGAMVCLAAVDNGVLAVTGFRSPDPYTWYFSKKALNVEAWDLYPLLFPELRRSISSTGGDGDLSMDLRQNPFANKRFKLMSYWSGWKKASGSEVSFDVDIPAFNGEVRLMAISVSGDKFGAAEATMKVADPLVLSTSMPRFMTPGDTVMAGVTISNTTAKATSVSAKVKVEGPLNYTAGQALETNIAPNAEGRIEFPVFASSSPGLGKITITATGLGETFTEVIDISVRPASTLQRRSGSGVITGGEKRNINIPVSDMLQQSVDYNLLVGRSPVLQLGTPLRYLVNYPYGCTEQSISMAFPQLYFAEMSQLMQEGGAFKNAAGQNIQTAIQKIKMRQLYNGGLTMWEAEGTESWWVTAYAAHFLVEARKAGYAPDAALLETMLQYLSSKLRKRDLVDYYYNGNQQKKIAPKEVAYSLYVLALAGRPNVPYMNYYKANRNDLALDSRYVLSATYALAGDKKSFTEMLPSSFAGEEAVATGNGSLYSAVRDEALALNVLLEADPANAQIPVMAQHLVQKLNKQTYFTTQEAAFSLLALGKMTKQAAKSTATAEVMVNGKRVGAMTGESIKLLKKQLAGESVTLDTKGSGKLYYWWQASGISGTGQFIQEDNFLKVRRQLLDRYGREISGNTFRQNDLVVVKITLEKSFNGKLENIVVTDLLPGGWEIENARIKDLPDMQWIKDETTPQSRDVRDDRIHLFTDMVGNRQVFYYSVRAVTPGTYQMGPLSADAMYQGEYHSYHGAGRIKVVR